MPRRKRASRREIFPDPIYNSQLVSKFVNRLMIQGKKAVAYRVFYQSLDLIQKALKKDPLDSFKKAIGTVRPLVEVRSRRIGGANYQIPVEVRESRSYTLAIRWLIGAAQRAPGRTIADRLSTEIQNILKNTGETMKKKETIHKMAEANKAFAHFRFR